MKTSKDMVQRPGKKTKKKIKLKFDIRRITNYLMIPVITVLIVGIGVFLPAFLLKRRSDPKNLPAGYIDIDEIQPYGAAYQEAKQGLASAILSLNDLMAYHGSYVDVSGTPYRTIAYYADHYSQIDVRESGDEFVYEFSNMLTDSYGYEAPESWEVRDLDENTVLVGSLDYLGEGFVIDTTTDVPIVGNVTVISREEGIDPSRCFYQIVDMYNEYTGLNFVNETNEDYTGDAYYWRGILTSDSSFELFVTITRQDYYPVDGGSLGEEYSVWTIYFYVGDVENNIFTVASG